MYFEEKYKPNSVMAYCDLGMFTGKVYKRMGYHLEYCTKPGYVWVNGTDVKTRYRTQKSELVRLGLGNHDMTEDEIMISNSYKKIYNCGNAVYVKKFK